MEEEDELLLPREKLLRNGVTPLTDDELLALFLRTGTPGKTVFTLAKELIAHFGSLYGLLTADLAQFKHIGGIGVAKYAQLRAIAELARRFNNVRLEKEAPILTPAMTREFLQSQLTDVEREIFMVIFLDNRNRVLKHSHLFSGTLNHVEVHPREIVPVNSVHKAGINCQPPSHVGQKLRKIFFRGIVDGIRQVLPFSKLRKDTSRLPGSAAEAVPVLYHSSCPGRRNQSVSILYFP